MLHMTREGRHLPSAAVAAIVLCAAILSPASANAYVKIGAYRLKYGVGNYGASNQHYFIDGSASAYAATINAAMNGWIYTTGRIGVTTPISYTRTTTRSSSRMDIYATTFPSDLTGRGILAATSYHLGDGTSVIPTKMNWVWGKVQLNKPNYSQLSAFNRQGTCAHEMGHVMGLDENNNLPGSVMCQLGAGRSVNLAQKDDANGINAIY